MTIPLDDELGGVYTEGMKTHSRGRDLCDWVVVGFAVGLGTMLTCLSGCCAAGGGHSDDRCSPDDTFSPGPPSLQQDVRDAAAQWQAALGRPVCVEDTGLPIYLVDELSVFEGLSNPGSCGQTYESFSVATHKWVRNNLIEIKALDTDNCPALKQTILHEMGHALGRTPTHIKEGLMQANYTIDQDWIDQASIDLVCANSFCAL